MPTPTAGDVHVNRPLTNISVAYVQDADSFIADQVFPNIPVMKQSDLYFTYSRDDFYRAEAQDRAPGTESAGGGYNIDHAGTYFAKVKALHKDIDDQVRQNADVPLDMDRDATIYLTQQLLLKREIDWAGKYFTTGVFTGDQTGVASAPSANQFLQFDAASSAPVTTLRAGITAIKARTGYKPNVLTLGFQVWQVLADHPDLLDRIKYTQKASVGPDLLATLLGLDKVCIAEAVQNTANEGQTGTYSFIEGKSMLLTYSTPRPGVLEPTAGYTYSWTGMSGAGPAGQRIKSFRMEWLEADRVEGEMAYDFGLVSADLGQFYASAVS